MLAVNFSFLAVPGVVIPGTPAGPIEIIIYGSVFSTITSIVFSFALLNMYSNPSLMALVLQYVFMVDMTAAAHLGRNRPEPCVAVLGVRQGLSRESHERSSTT